MDAVLEQLREYQQRLRDCEDEVTSARATIDGHVGSLHAAESAMNEHKANFLSATEELARLEEQLLRNSRPLVNIVTSETQTSPSLETVPGTTQTDTRLTRENLDMILGTRRVSRE